MFSSPQLTIQFLSFNTQRRRTETNNKIYILPFPNTYLFQIIFMKKILPITFWAFAILSFGGCKKNNPTVVGNWQVSNYSAVIKEINSTPDTSFYLYSYSSESKKLFEISKANFAHQIDTSVTLVNYSDWNIKSNGTYTILENSGNAGSTTASWEFLSNSKPNDLIGFNSGGSIFLEIIQGINAPINALNIQTLTEHNMVLSYYITNMDSSGSQYLDSTIITFTK
jgi:hypothetical protein